MKISIKQLRTLIKEASGPQRRKPNFMQSSSPTIDDDYEDDYDDDYDDDDRSDIGTVKVNFKIQTAGTGFWSAVKKLVRVTKIEYDILRSRTELNVYFDRKTWDTEEDGLIYTDPKFLKELKAELQKLSNKSLSKLNWNKLDYTEQGMQGYDFVSLEL